MNYEEWYLQQVKDVVTKNAFSQYTDKNYLELSKSIKNSLKRQKIFPQDSWQFERKINFGILKFTRFSLKQIVNITKFFYQDLNKDFEEFFQEFKSHKHFYYTGYMKSSDYKILSYDQWFYKEFCKAHKEFSDQFKNQLSNSNFE
jgi:hypothetical protein